MRNSYERSEMGNPYCLAPLLAAILPSLIGGAISAGGSIFSGLLGSSATNMANEANVEAAKQANAVQNQQWGVEIGLKKQEIDQQALSKFHDWLNETPDRKKKFIDMWGGK